MEIPMKKVKLQRKLLTSNAKAPNSTNFENFSINFTTQQIKAFLANSFL